MVFLYKVISRCTVNKTESGVIAFVGETWQSTMATAIFRTQSAHSWLLLLLAISIGRPLVTI
jgi:hypothetical protein